MPSAKVLCSFEIFYYYTFELEIPLHISYSSGIALCYVAAF